MSSPEGWAATRRPRTIEPDPPSMRAAARALVAWHELVIEVRETNKEQEH